MALAAGTRLGPYEIVAPLGAGGMGEVYQARDTRLDRTVAIKILAPELTADPDRRIRFEREARTASSLNHPNIVTIYEINEIGSVRFIAMEHIQGRTLRELIQSGPVSMKKLLDVATQTAAALAKAHAAGIVHRDLKPENIMVTTDGVVKLLDFGLARSTPSASNGDAISQLTTESPTSPGIVLGTVAYMSPEQASGQVVDFRSDQFSFGSVLYEMATGLRPFRKATAVDTLSAIVHEEPAPIEARVPAPLRWTIERCHAKAPGDRYDSTGDLARELASLRLHFSSATDRAAAAAAVALPHPQRRRFLLGAAGAGVLAAGVGLGHVLGRWIEARGQPRFRRLTDRYGVVGSAHFAPGGQAVVYSASWAGRPFRVLFSSLGSQDARDLGIEGYLIDVSPKGDLLFTVSADPFGGATHALWLASLSGTAPRALAENVRSAVFSPDGSQIALIRPVDSPGMRSRLEFPIGEALYESTGELFGIPNVSPDGSGVTMAERTDTSIDIIAVDRSGRRSTLVSFPGQAGLFSFVGQHRNWIMRGNEHIGTEILEVTSAGRLRSWLRVPLYVVLGDVAQDGRWLVTSHRFRTEMFVLAQGDARPRSISWSGTSVVADLSADGRTVLFTETARGEEYGVYLRTVEESPAVRLGPGQALALSPDGRWALAATGPEGDGLVLYPTGPGDRRVVSAPGIALVGGRFFPRGDRLLLFGSEAAGTRCYVVSLAGGAPRPLGPATAVLPPRRLDRAVIAEDGQSVLLGTRDGWWRVAADDGETGPAPVGQLARDERVLRFRKDGNAVFTKCEEAEAIVIEAVELETGRRQLLRRLPLGRRGIRLRAPPPGAHHARWHDDRLLGLQRNLGAVPRGLAAVAPRLAGRIRDPIRPHVTQEVPELGEPGRNRTFNQQIKS